MRKRERDDVAAAARRRLEALSVELAGLRREADPRERERPFDPSLEPSLEGPPGGPRGVPPGVSQRPPAPRAPRPGPSVPAQRRPVPEETDPDPFADPGPGPGPGRGPGRGRDHEHDHEQDTDWFLERPRPVLAGAPGALASERSVIHTPVGRPLPPDPARVPVPGRHSVDRVPPSVGEWVEDRLPGAVRGRLALSGQHLVLLTGVLGVALAVAGWLALRGGSGDESVPQARFVSQQTDPSGSPAPSGSTGGSTSGAGGASPTGSGTGAAGTAAATGGDVVVDVVGKVHRPGIVTLPAGSRVNDAVLKAGGVRSGARTDGLNLARVLVDGEQIVVGQPATATAVTGGGSAPSTAAESATGASGTGALVNLNTAGLSELDTLPGVGPVTAQKILDWRGAHGAFSSVDELLEVDGIGDKTLADIAPRATL